MATRPRGETRGRLAALCLLFALILVMGASLPSLAQRPDAVAKMKEAGAEQQKSNDVGALGLLEEAIKVDPSWFAPRIVDAQIRFGLKQYPEAIKHLETVLLTKGYRFPTDKAPEYWVLLGKCRFEAELDKKEAERKFDGTVAAFEKAISLDKKLHEPNYYLARVALAKNDVPKANDYLKAALEAQPTNPQYLVLQADLRYRQGDLDGATTALNDAVEKLAGMKETREYSEATALQKRIAADQGTRKWKKYALIGGPILGILLLAAVGLVFMRGRQDGAVMLEGDMGTDGGTYEEICVAALRRLSALTQMAHGVVYITTMDGDEMVPKATLALEPEEVKAMPVDINEMPRWVERNDGKPFLFKSEKKEGTFIKAYPEVREVLEPLQIRIGVPFLFQDRVLGMAFLGMEESKDILRFKKLYERSQGDIYRLAMEYAAALHRLYEDELAYIDVLTKFKSRRYVDENLPRAMVDAEDNGRKGAVIMFEFDQFRGLQEQYGDPQAEAVLKTVAAEVKLAIPAEDGLVARFEGGKFFAFAPVKDAAEAMKLGDRIKARVSDTRISRNFPSPTASVAVAVFPDNGKKADDLIWAADRVMMGLSAGGGNAVGAVDGAAPSQGPSRTAAPTAPAAPSKATEAPRPFVGGPAAPSPLGSTPPPPPTPFVPGFSGGPLKPSGPTATGFTPRNIPTSAEAPAGPKAGGIPGFSGSGPTPPPTPPKSGGIPGFPGTPAATPSSPPKAGGIPGFPGAGPAAPPTLPKTGGIPGFSGAGPAAPPTPPKTGGIPGFSGSGPAEPSAPPPPPLAPPRKPDTPTDDTPSPLPSRGGSAGLTRKGTAKGDAGGMKAKGPASGPGAGKSTLGGSGRPMFPTGAARPTLASGASPEDASDESAETPATPPSFATVAPPAAAAPPSFPGGAPTAPTAPKPAFPGAPPVFPGAPPTAPAAPAAAKPAFPGAPSAFPGAPSAFPGAPPSLPGAPPAAAAATPPPAAPPPAFPGAAPKSPVPPVPARGAEEFRTRPATPSTPSWLQAEIEANPPAAPAQTPKSGLLGGKGGGGGKLFRRATPEGGDTPAATPPAAAAPAPAPTAPEAWPIAPSDRDATGFVSTEVLQSALAREIERSQALRDHCTVLYLHLDQHDDIAERLGDGRLAGIKNEIASLINDFLKEGTDIPGHWDQGLVIVLPRTASRIACNLAEQIRFTVSHLSFPDLNGNSTLSIGVAACPEHGHEASALVAAAQTAAGQAGSEGGNTIKVYGI